MFDILFDSEIVTWTPEGIPVLIDFVQTSEDSDDA
jgi:hypothetical protein